MPENTAQKTRQRLILIASGLFFLGSSSYGLIGMFNRPTPEPSSPTTQTQATAEQKLKLLQEKEKGYQKVLDREPNNPFALQGLVETRLQMNNLAGAVEPLEKLIKLYPEQEELKVLLARIKQELETPGSSQPQEK